MCAFYVLPSLSILNDEIYVKLNIEKCSLLLLKEGSLTSMKKFISIITILATMITMIPSFSFAETQYNSEWLTKLPTSEFIATQPLLNGFSENFRFELDDGFTFYLDEYPTSELTLNEIKDKAIEATKGKTTDYTKTQAIYDFTSKYLKYDLCNITLNSCWKMKVGKCSHYALLSSIMLYDIEIPNGYILTDNHLFNVVLCDGKWIAFDATNKTFDMDDKSKFMDEAIYVIIPNGKSVILMDKSGKITNAKIRSDEPTPPATCEHEASFVEYKAPTCINAGNESCYYCSKCKKHFSDANCENELTNWTIDKVAHDYTHYSTPSGYLTNGLSYDKCSMCGKVINKVTIAGYSTSYVKSFKVSKGKKCFTAKWKKQSKVNQKKFDGYQIRYSTSSSMSNAKSVYVKKSAKSKKISKLKKKTKYYVQVRTYKNVGGVKNFSKWSTKSVKTR